MKCPNASNFGVARVTKNEWNIQMKTQKVFNLVFLNASNFGIANVTKNEWNITYGLKGQSHSAHSPMATPWVNIAPTYAP